MPIDIEPSLLQQSYHLPEKKHVLKGPTRERDGAYSPGLPELLAARNDHLGHRAVEPGGYFPRLTPGQEILDHPGYGLPGLHHPSFAFGSQPERVSLARRTFRGQLQLYRGLPLVGGAPGPRHPHQRRDGVEEPARAGGRRGVQLALYEPAYEPHVSLPCSPYHRERELQDRLLTVKRKELCEGHAPGLPDGRGPAGQGGVFQMRPPYEPFPDAPLQELPAPDGPVGPVAGPIERHPDDPLLARPLIVRQAAGDVGVVVLHAYGREPGFLQLAGVLGGEVLGVQVVGYQLRLYVEEPAVVLDPLPEGAQGLVRPLPRNPHHTIVAAHVDGPVVDQEEVGYVPKLLEGFLVPIGYGLVGAVAAGHHERYPRIVQQQVV